MRYYKNRMIEKEMKMTKVTKTSVTLSTMRLYSDKPMNDVVRHILEAQHAAGFTDVSLKICEGAYRWAVRKGMAAGSVPASSRVARKVVKKAKTKAQVIKELSSKPAGEIARIRAANLAKLKEVSSRFEQKSFAPKQTVNTVDRNDPFVAPAFLTKEEVIALV